MKIQKRQHIFETNSSSVHALCIYNEKPAGFILPDEVTIRPGEFGWAEETYSDTASKLSYVYQMCKEVDDEWEYFYKRQAEGQDMKGYTNWAEKADLKPGQVKRFVKILEDLGIRVWLDERPGAKSWLGGGYIDHGDEWFGVLDDFLSDTDQLVRFLFVEQSMVQTGNDNDDSYSRVGVMSHEMDKYTVLCK